MRKGCDGLAMLAQEVLKKSRIPGTCSCSAASGPIASRFCGGTARACAFAKRLEGFVWPLAREGAMKLTPAQLSMRCEGIDWRLPVRTDGPRDAPTRAG